MGLFDLIETQFYNPSITNSFTSKVRSDTAVIDMYLKKLQKQFKDILEERSVKISFIPNQSAEQINERARLFMNLFSDITKLQSVRLVDAAGIRIHFSTLQSDILRQDIQSVAYRNYNYREDEIPYAELEVTTRDAVKLTLDQKTECIIFSFPVFDIYEVYRGTAFFTLSIAAVAEELISNKSINVSEHLSVVTDPNGSGSGMVLGFSDTNIDALTSRIASIWHDDILTFRRLDSPDSGVVLVLISAKTSQGIFFGRLLKESLFAFPREMKALLLAAFFVTVYLSFFLLFNLRQDNMTIIQNRLKSLQISLIEQYYDRKGDIDFTRWSRELEQRRDEIRMELKRGIKKSKDKKNSEDIDALIDKSWDELLKVIGGRSAGQITANIDEEKLQGMLNRILASGNYFGAVPPQAGQNALAAPARKTQAPQDSASDLEEMEEVEELADAEALSEIEELPGEMEELSDEIEELPEEMEELSEAEELSDTPEDIPAAAQEAEEITGTGEAENTEENSLEKISDTEPLDEAEDLVEVYRLPALAKTYGIQPNMKVEELEAEPDDGGETMIRISAAPDIQEGSQDEQIEELEEIEEASDVPLDGGGAKNVPVAGAGSAASLPDANRLSGGKRRSNIRLAFGEDDIPYIVESNGLELVDDDIMIDNQGGKMEELKKKPMNLNDDDVEEVEELEELPPEELETLEEAEELSAAEESSAQEGSKEDIAEIARRIEFDMPVAVEEDTGEAIELLESNLEVVSPFSTIFSDEDEESAKENDKPEEAGTSETVKYDSEEDKKKRNS
jgi:hypothetical protein